jgi:uncharacterized surface protein with fasciclin (FAS1) repeats
VTTALPTSTVSPNTTESPVEGETNMTTPPTPTVNSTVIDDIILEEDDLSTLAAAFNASGLVGVLCPDCNYTLFAPTNSAFSEIDQDFLTRLLTPPWVAHLTGLLSFHATQSTTERVLSTDLEDGAVITMLNGQNVTVAVVDEGLAVTSAYTEQSNVVQADLVAENGVLHKVDAVLLPEFVVTDLVGLGNSTGGSGFTILFGIFELLQIGGLIPATEFFTVFAPTDAAFLALGNDTLNSLLEEESRETLTSILLNHVVQGVVPSALVTDGLVADTVGELNLTFSVSPNGITVNNASVVVPDVLASNGIVHAIDAVLMMPTSTNTTESPVAPETTDSPVVAPTATDPPDEDESPAPVAPQDETEAPVETPTTRSGGEAAFSFCSGLAGILMAFVISH